MNSGNPNSLFGIYNYFIRFNYSSLFFIFFLLIDDTDPSIEDPFLAKPKFDETSPLMDNTADPSKFYIYT